jgi:hypothetical protein
LWQSPCTATAAQQLTLLQITNPLLDRLISTSLLIPELLTLFVATQQVRRAVQANPLQENPCTATAAQQPTSLLRVTTSTARCARELVRMAGSWSLPAMALSGASRTVPVHPHHQVCAKWQLKGASSSFQFFVLLYNFPL